jgi:MoxR-like ATPase
VNAVVLIDEIDKADPDLPNNLLVPLGSLEFYVEPLRYRVEGRQPPLIFITTNRERELPKAFLRRCVTLHLPAPDAEQLVKIAVAVIPEGEEHTALLRQVADHVVKLAAGDEEGSSPSTAEYLDTVKACLSLGITPESERFESLSRITLVKSALGGER